MNRVVIEDCDGYSLKKIKSTLLNCFNNFGLDNNNPLKDYIKPGDTVFIKPNFVASRWRKSADHVDTIYSVITHPNVIEAMCYYVDIALNGNGEIIIGDNPSIDANFDELMELTGLKNIINKFKTKISICDLRPLVCDNLDNYGKKDLMISHKGDPKGYTTINLGKESLFYGMDSSRFRGVFDEREETIKSHSGEDQFYSFSNSIYNANCFISIPKMKTHQKVGCTLNLKGLVGSIANKNQLVHWQIGYPENGGDEYSTKEEWNYYQTQKVQHRGSWPGNDTIWRMVADLYKGLLKKERKYLSIVDGIIAGEGQGPFCPMSKNANTLVFGDDFLNVDLVTARYMGFNPIKIKYLNYYIEKNKMDLNKKFDIIVNGNLINNYFNYENKYKDFVVLDKWNEIKI